VSVGSVGESILQLVLYPSQLLYVRHVVLEVVEFEYVSRDVRFERIVLVG